MLVVWGFIVFVFVLYGIGIFLARREAATGVEKDKAERVAMEVSTKMEAKEFSATKADLFELKGSLIRWNIGIVLAGFAFLFGLIILFFGVW